MLNGRTQFLGESIPIIWVRRTIARAQLTVDTVSLAAFGIPFLLYLLTLAPTIYNLDSAELTTAAASGGIVRATGYPLYLLIGRAWSFLPIGDVGYRMNLFSAFTGALTIVLAERILRRLNVGPWARLGALGLLATAPYFWSLSLIAEVYTLHTALMAAVILLLLRWRDRPAPHRLVPAVFLVALSLGNHAATLLLVPGCIWFVLTVAPREALRPRTLLLSSIAVIAGLSIYLYLPIRFSAQPEFNYAGWYDANASFLPVDLGTPSGLWWLITGKSFSGQMFAYDFSQMKGEAMNYGAQLWAAFFALGIGPGLLGLATTWRRDWRLGTFLILLFVVNAIFYINYRVIDKNTMFLPTYLVWALWLGVGYQVVLSWFKDPVQRWPLFRPSWILRGLIVGVVILAAAWNWRLVDLSDDWSTRELGQDILQEVEPGAIVLGWWDTVPAVEYLQLIEGQRPDVQAINRFLISGDDLEQLISQEIGQRPIYIDSPPSSLLKYYDAVPLGSVYQLRPRIPKGGDAYGRDQLMNQWSEFTHR